MDVVLADEREERVRDVWTCRSCGRLPVFGERGLTVYEKVVDSQSTIE